MQGRLRQSPINVIPGSAFEKTHSISKKAGKNFLAGLDNIRLNFYEGFFFHAKPVQEKPTSIVQPVGSLKDRN